MTTTLLPLFFAAAVFPIAQTGFVIFISVPPKHIFVSSPIFFKSNEYPDKVLTISSTWSIFVTMSIGSSLLILAVEECDTPLILNPAFEKCSNKRTLAKIFSLPNNSASLTGFKKYLFLPLGESLCDTLSESECIKIKYLVKCVMASILVSVSVSVKKYTL